MTLAPVLLGALLGLLAAQFAGGEAQSASVVAGCLALLGLVALGLGYATARVFVGAFVRARGDARAFRRYLLAGRALWILLLGLHGVALEAGGIAAAARDLPLEGAAALLGGAWLLVCFAAWTGAFLGERRALAGTQRLRDELRSKGRRVLVPVVVFGTLGVVVTRLGSLEAARELFDLWPHARPLAVAAGALVLFSLGPLVVRTLAPTRPLELPGLPAWLEAVAGKLAYRDWDLGTSVATASVAGLRRNKRTVFVTRALREALDPAELAAVVGHEVGHAALGHLGARAAFAALIVLGLDDASAALERALPGSVALEVLVLLAALAAIAGGFVWLARRLEHDADLFAAERAGGEVIVTALAKACQANGISPDRGGLLHPSPRRRIELVRRASLEPGLAARRLGRSRGLLAGLTALAVLATAGVGYELSAEARRPVRDRLLAAAVERLAGGESEIARGYVERALASGEDARALVLRARARPASERDAALADLARAQELEPLDREPIEQARKDLLERR